MEQYIDAADQRRRSLAGAQAVAGLVQGNERRRASRVDGHRGPMQIKHIRKPVGREAERVTRHGMTGHGRDIVHDPHAVVDA